MVEIPNNMFREGRAVPGDRIADCFADFFEAKVKNLVAKTGVDPNVENGVQQPAMADGNFMKFAS